MNKYLPPGLYERLVTLELRKSLSLLKSEQMTFGEADEGDAYVLIAEHLRRIFERTLRSLPESDRISKQAELCNKVLSWIHEQMSGDPAVGDESSKTELGLAEALSIPVEILREIKAVDRGAAFARSVQQPSIPLTSMDLLVNARNEPRVGRAIESEIYSADRIDLICAFIRWNGLRVLMPAIEAHRDAGRPLRVITTVYTGSTERRALDWLVSTGAQVKVSYDTKTTRLHAKAWLFERQSGFSTAYIGSSNLTHSALQDGLEWNVRFAQTVTPELIERFKGTFESYWAHPDFEN